MPNPKAHIHVYARRASGLGGAPDLVCNVERCGFRIPARCEVNARAAGARFADELTHETCAFTARLEVPGQPQRRELVQVPAGIPCSLTRPQERGDTGRRLQPGYVRVVLAQPVAGRTVFYTPESNLRESLKSAPRSNR